MSENKLPIQSRKNAPNPNHPTGQYSMDDRSVVNSSADLINPSMWKTNRDTGEGDNTWYVGMVVSSKDGELYQLLDTVDETKYYPEAKDWKKVGSNPGAGREIKVNGVSKIGVDSTSALDISSGNNILLSYTNGQLVITSNASNTDTIGINTNVASKTTNVYLLGQDSTSSKSNSQGAYLYDASVYINNGVLYENNKSFHESNDDDWGYIDATHK